MALRFSGPVPWLSVYVEDMSLAMVEHFTYVALWILIKAITANIQKIYNHLNTPNIGFPCKHDVLMMFDFLGHVDMMFYPITTHSRDVLSYYDILTWCFTIHRQDVLFITTYLHDVLSITTYWHDVLFITTHWNDVLSYYKALTLCFILLRHIHILFYLITTYWQDVLSISDILTCFFYYDTLIWSFYDTLIWCFIFLRHIEMMFYLSWHLAMMFHLIITKLKLCFIYYDTLTWCLILLRHIDVRQINMIF